VLAAVLLALFAGAPSAEGADASLKSAIEDFEFGEHAVAADKLRKALEPPIKLKPEELIVARQYLGACYHLLNDKERAKAQFSMLLALDPKHRLDPEVFSPALVEFFEQVRAEAGLPTQTKTDTGDRTNSEASGSKTKVDLDVKPHEESPPLALAFVPFGVGQFNNRQPVKGVVFGAAEVGLFATAIATFVMFNGLKLPSSDPRCMQDSACFKNSDDASTASTLQTVYLTTFWIGLGVAAIGIAEALISYPGDAK
jgi:hypothetical protein